MRTSHNIERGVTKRFETYEVLDLLLLTKFVAAFVFAVVIFVVVGYSFLQVS